MRWGSGDAREAFERGGEVVRLVTHEGVEAVAEACLADELERDAAHPLCHVELGGPALCPALNSLLELKTITVSYVREVCVLLADVRVGQHRRRWGACRACAWSRRWD